MTDNELKEHCLQEAGVDLGRYSNNELNAIKDALSKYHNTKIKANLLICHCNKWHDRMEISNNNCSTCSKPIN